MIKIVTGLLAALFFIGCSSQESTQVDVTPKLVVGKSLQDLKLNDQNETSKSIEPTTTKLIFAFSKDMGHQCNDFFATKDASYLKDHQAQFVADVSGAPSLIRSMFILPGLKDFKHPIMIIVDENISASFKSGVESEKIIVAELDNKTITGIKSFNSVTELDNYLNGK